jgi:ABC-2 type transport system permease protein
MNATVLRTSLRGAARTTVILSVAAGAFFFLVLLSSATFVQDIFVEDIAQVGFFQDPPRVIEAFLGGAADFSTPAGWLVTAMMHPIVLALLTAAAFVVAAGAVAAELERGSLDLVLSRPVPRRAFLTAKMVASLVVVTAVQVGGLIGVLVARSTLDEIRGLPLGGTLRAFLGSWILFAAFAMVATYLSARSSLRGRALGTAAGVVVGTFFVNFISLLFDEVEPMGYASPFRYFRAADLIEGQGLPELLVLIVLGVLFAGLAHHHFARRDLTA